MNRFKCIYKTPQEFDDILLESDGEYLTRLEFIDSNNINIDESFNINLEVFKKTFEYLDKDTSYTDETIKIIRKDEVLKLSSGGNELYGFQFTLKGNEKND